MQPKQGDWIASSRRNPCPICGRDADGDCRTSGDGLEVLCHHGSSFAPPAGLKRGDTVVGKDGASWAFTGDTGDGRAAHFTIDKPKRSTARSSGTSPTASSSRPLARLPKPAPAPPAHWPNDKRLPYSGKDGKATQWVVVVVGEDDKRHIPHHDADGRTVKKAGPDPWPLWREAEALQHGPGHWIAEAEGEKCADWLRAGGLVAVSQPGHDHRADSIEQRYGRLKAAGVLGVAYLADNDKTGTQKAKRCAAAAAAAGLDFLVLNAAELWPGIPTGGSIDDATGSPAGRCRVFAAAVQAAKAEPFAPRPDTAVRWGKRTLSHAKAMACFDRCIQVQAKAERNSLRRRARLLKAAADLGIAKYVNRQEISQRILESKDQQEGRSFAPLSAADRLAMERPRVRWLVPGLVPEQDATILGGRAKVGKTRLAVALAGAVLNGKGMFDMGDPTPRDVVLVSDDQADGDTADMLDGLDLWSHPRLTWSRHFRLTEADLEQLLDTVRRLPGALVILDSLRSISRSLQHGENDPELGVMLYDLKSAVTEAGGTLLLIHHCNKSDGLVGVEALSGHNAIAGAANGILTLHYLPDDKGRPRKDDPQRRLVREARSGQALDMVISPLAGTGNFYGVGSFADWQRTQEEAQSEKKKAERLTPDQRRALEVLTDDGGWLTRRQVCDALGVKWADRGRNPEAQRVTRALGRLVAMGMAESQRTGVEATWRASHGTQLGESPMTLMPPSDAKGSGVITSLDDSDAHFSDRETTASMSSPARIGETEGRDRVASLSSPIRVSDPLPADEALIDKLIALWRQRPCAQASTIAIAMDPTGSLGVTGRKVKAWLKHPAVQSRIAAGTAA